METDLKLRVKFKEVESLVFLVQVFHCTSTHITHHLSQTHRSLGGGEGQHEVEDRKGVRFQVEGGFIT